MFRLLWLNRNRAYVFLLRRKYQFMEVSTTKRAGGLKEKIPDIQKTLATVQFLQKRKVSQIICRELLK